MADNKPDKRDPDYRDKKDEPEPNAGIMSEVNPDPVPGHPIPVESPEVEDDAPPIPDPKAKKD